MKSTARLCPVVEGVSFTFFHHRQLIRGVILREALESRFGAGAHPESWLQAFEAHEKTITRLAVKQFIATPQSAIVLLRPLHCDAIIDGGPAARSPAHAA